jgi:carbohydrate diacid regulator
VKLSIRLSKQISSKAHAILDRQVLVADATGSVLAGHGSEPAFSAEALNCAQTGRQINADFEGMQIKWIPFVYDNETLGVFGISLETGPITPEAVSLIQGLAEVITYQYFLIDRIQSLEVMRADFIREALTAPNVDVDDLYRRADILQLNLRAPQAAVLMRIEDFEKNTLAKYKNLNPEEQRSQLVHDTDHILTVIRDGFKNYQDNLVAYLGRNTFLIIKGIGGDNLTTQNTIRFILDRARYAQKLLIDLQRGEVTVGVGQYYPNLGGLRKSYQDARLALEVGTRVWGPGRVYHIKQVGMFITLANATHERKAELAHQILAPLLRDDQLFKTVRTFLASGLNLTNAAETLHIHRNTLIYRLDKTKKLIGLDPRHFDDALQIKLGLMFYQPVEV